MAEENETTPKTAKKKESASNIREVLADIQSRLDVPKTHQDNAGRYKYRKCEDILQGLKHLLAEHKASVILTDEVVQIGDRFYVRATASLVWANGDLVSTIAFAREASEKKGMDVAQVTGSSSSYARKYALNGLFAIDDEQDADALTQSQTTGKAQPLQATRTAPPPTAPPPIASPNPDAPLSSEGWARIYQVLASLEYKPDQYEPVILQTLNEIGLSIPTVLKNLSKANGMKVWEKLNATLSARNDFLGEPMP